MWLAGASGVLPPLSAVTVSRSLQNWQEWADSYASMIKDGWATLRSPVAAALHTQAAAWHCLLRGEMDTGGQTSVDAWVQAGRSMVRTSRQLVLAIVRHFWLLLAVIAAATGGLLYLAIANSSGTAKVWTSLATVAAAFGITGASLRAAAIRAATGMEQDISRAASFDARAWGATWLPTVPQGRLQQYRLANRGVAAPRPRNGLEMPARSAAAAGPARRPLRRCRRRCPRPEHLAGYGDGMTDMDAMTERILTSYATITVVGASATATKAAHSVPAYMQRHGWRIIPVNPHAEKILGEPVYRTLAEVPEQVGLVDVFRPSWQAPDIARQAVAAGATALWLQLGIVSAQARAIAEAAGLLYVEDRCLIIEQRRLGLEAPDG